MQPDVFFDRYALSSVIFEPLPLDDVLRRFADAGFRWVEITADDHFHLDPRLDVNLDRLSALLASLGIGVHSVHATFTDTNIGHPTLGDPSVYRPLVVESIRRAGALGARAVVVHPAAYHSPVPPDQQDEARRISIDFINDMIQVAEENATRIAVENMIYRGDWRYGKSMVDLAADLTDPRVGFCVDTGHALLNHLDVAGELRAAGSRLISLHAANNDGGFDQHKVPTDGLIDWNVVERTLREMAYPSRIVLEVIDRKTPSDVTFARVSRLYDEIPW